ncbi:hypothetical protein [Prauserella cavernicola]|uniref:Uncharacterized protein n=1 Tax=Prauserella cavernicola TaxID=2800127 RepID=A0A934QPJ8_9PSEU|nr:hypothetical protein [Prauserella cavernicola]MBK1784280.1 hypothetical protein [Prauserella cavernicola]
MNPDRLANAVGAVTLAMGVALTAAPRRSAEVLRLGEHPRFARAVGAADLALAPGLLRRRPHWAWLAVRTGLNLVIANHYRRENQAAPAAGMAALTVVDGTLAAVLRRQQTQNSLPSGSRSTA